MPLLVAVLLSLLLTPAAHAAWFPADAIDGPSPEIERLGGVDLARDGTGGLVYVKRAVGVSHVYVSRHFQGVWHAPERVDAGLDLAVSEAAVAAADSHRLAVVWIAGHRVYGTFFPEGQLPGAPAPPTLLHEDASGGQITGLSLDMGINGTAFATFTTPGGGGGDVKAVRLFGGTWEPVPGPLDVDAAQDAGREASRSRVVVAADGNPVVVWGEGHADGRRRAYGRRIYVLTPSPAPQELSVPDFGGQPGGHADSPEIDIEWDGSFAWAAWRQDIGGVSRTLTRRLVGSQFEAAAAVDLGGAADAPHVAINGRGTGAIVAGIAGGVVATQIKFDRLRATERIETGGGRDGAPLVAAADNDNTDLGFVWRAADGQLLGRYLPFELPFEPQAAVLRPEFGPVAPGGYGISSDRSGNMAVAALTGDAAGRRIAVGVYDVPPGTPATGGDRGFQRRSRPTFSWRPGLDLWGPQTFRVLIDGVEAGRTSGTTTFVPPVALADGRHTWQIVAVDARGQEKPGTLRKIGVDATGPRVRVRVSGRRKAGKPIRVIARAFDGRGSGVRSYSIAFGDRSRAVPARRAVRRFRAGTFTVRVRAVDKVGNVGVKRLRLRIKR